MKRISIIFMVLGLFCFEQIFAQKDSLISLNTVVLSDVKLKDFSEGSKIEKISDSVIRTKQSFTNLLNFNSLIYFKENGAGMVSSPSFRGTNASQTAVIWNGLNINSQLTGQTDFNNISSMNYDGIYVKSGGGSVQYGSGAVGGSIHLNNTFQFFKHLNNDVFVSYGSFNTLNANYGLSFGTDKTFVSAGIDVKNSDNDYEYLGYDKVNENGSYDFIGFNINIGQFINNHFLLKMYHNLSLNNRNLSGTLTYNAKDAYEDINSKTMLVLDFLGEIFSSNIKIANIFESYKYFPDSNISDNYTEGKVNSLIFKYDASWNFKPSNLLLKGIVEYDFIKGEGTNIEKHPRNVFSAVVLLNHKPIENLSYGINLRTEITNQYGIPFIFSVDSKYEVNDFYSLKFNISENYRIPTFNDLYWVPGGNTNLNPEKSWQVELGHDFQFKGQQINLTGFYIKSKDQIKWLPQSGTIWSPINVENTESYGLELQYKIERNINNNHIEFIGNYGYTISKDLDSKIQMIYVPKHKLTSSFAYGYKKFSAYYQFLINGKVFTTTDNSNELNAYDISDIGFKYRIIGKNKLRIDLAFTIQNVFNEVYQNVAYRPMPNRNYTIKLNFKF